MYNPWHEIPTLPVSGDSLADASGIPPSTMTPPLPFLWDRLTADDFADAVRASGGVALLPLGCLEKHGRHLPRREAAFEGIGCDQDLHDGLHLGQRYGFKGNFCIFADT